MAFHLAKSKRVKRAVLKTKMLLNNYPAIKTFVSQLRFSLWRMQVHLRDRQAHPAFAADRTCYANPADIRYICENPQTTVVARKYANRGKVLAGDWDRLGGCFEDTDLYHGFVAHFLNKVSWPETDLYKRVISELNSGQVRYGCKSQDDYDIKCKELDEMFEDIKRSGYKSQKDIAAGEKDPYKGEDEISVCIGRDGALLFEDGRHRLALAKILGLKRVPIKITMVHKLWHDFRMEIVDYARTHGGKIYQRIWHPDLASIPALHGDERLEMIKQSLPCNRDELLDIGAHWGYWCQRFEEFGFECHAIESSIKNVYFMKKLRRAENKHFVIHNCSVFDYQGPVKFDIVLALSIFHHFLKDRGSYQKLIQLLRSLDMDAMFFEPHKPGENTMVGSYCDFNNQEFVDFILENSCLRSSKHIGQAHDDRNLYLLQR